MKHNKRYRKLGLAPTVEPTPMTPEGTHALVERFYAFRRDPPPPRGVLRPPHPATATKPHSKIYSDSQG